MLKQRSFVHKRRVTYFVTDFHYCVLETNFLKQLFSNSVVYQKVRSCASLTIKGLKIVDEELDYHLHVLLIWNY